MPCGYTFIGPSPLLPRPTDPIPKDKLRNMRALPLLSATLLSETILPSTSKQSLRLIYVRDIKILVLSFPHQGGITRLSAPGHLCSFNRQADVLTVRMPLKRMLFNWARLSEEGVKLEYARDERVEEWVRREVGRLVREGKELGGVWGDGKEGERGEGWVQAKCVVMGNTRGEVGSAERLAHGFVLDIINDTSPSPSFDLTRNHSPLAPFTNPKLPRHRTDPPTYLCSHCNNCNSSPHSNPSPRPAIPGSRGFNSAWQNSRRHVNAMELNPIPTGPKVTSIGTGSHANLGDNVKANIEGANTSIEENWRMGLYGDGRRGNGAGFGHWMGQMGMGPVNGMLNTRDKKTIVTATTTTTMATTTATEMNAVPAVSTASPALTSQTPSTITAPVSKLDPESFTRHVNPNNSKNTNNLNGKENMLWNTATHLGARSPKESAKDPQSAQQPSNPPQKQTAGVTTTVLKKPLPQSAKTEKTPKGVKREKMEKTAAPPKKSSNSTTGSLQVSSININAPRRLPTASKEVWEVYDPFLSTPQPTAPSAPTAASATLSISAVSSEQKQQQILVDLSLSPTIPNWEESGPTSSSGSASSSGFGSDGPATPVSMMAMEMSIMIPEGKGEGAVRMGLGLGLRGGDGAEVDLIDLL